MDSKLYIYGKKFEYIKKVLREQKYQENMPNRRDSVIGKMIEEIQEICKDLELDSLEYALLNQSILGRYLGFCLSEQAQNEENRKIFTLQLLIT